MFWAVPLSIIMSFPLYIQQCYTLYRFTDSLWAGSEWDCFSILILLASCQQMSMTYTIAVCTVENSWWWTEELSETCRVSFHKLEKLMHLVCLIVRNNVHVSHRNQQFWRTQCGALFIGIVIHLCMSLSCLWRSFPFTSSPVRHLVP
jgi:hypothetical protein